MKLIERSAFLRRLNEKFEETIHGEGHCILVSGEAGIGKSSLVRAFCNTVKKDCKIYQGTCDALFTPRPLAPLYDIIWQLGSDNLKDQVDIGDKSGLFISFLGELRSRKETTVIIFEDIHWADEATLDFIKFLGRRISQTNCLFILTYRDDEIHFRHPLINISGQLAADAFTRLKLEPLSRNAVEKMAGEKGFDGRELYRISGGNPFYVNEILAGYSPGIPDNIRDSILAVYHKQDPNTRQLWELLSIFPSGIEVHFSTEMVPLFSDEMRDGIDSKILQVRDNRFFFKHELYRITVEEALPSKLRVDLNREVLDLFLDRFEFNQEIERIIHHAKDANADELICQYAPIAAAKSAAAGSHADAARLYLMAIDYHQRSGHENIMHLYESYAYECYLVHSHKEAIRYMELALERWKEEGNQEKTGDGLRFLSRLWWFEGNRLLADRLGLEAVEVLKDMPISKAKAMVYSNMAQLKMLQDQSEDCLQWGRQACEIAREMDDQQTLAHALNSIGSALMTVHGSITEGIAFLNQSLEIALKHAFHEHVARAYTALGSNAVSMKLYEIARQNLDLGILYCEERDMDSLKLYMLGYKARLFLETGHWEQASVIAEDLLKKEDLLPVIKIGALTIVGTLKLRNGDATAAELLLEAKAIALETMELHRIVPALAALLECEWIEDRPLIEDSILDNTVAMIAVLPKIAKKNKLYFWLRMARKTYLPPEERYESYVFQNELDARQEAAYWKKLGCPYEQALMLFEGNEDDQRNALTILQDLGAKAVYNKLKKQMRFAGLRKIPRGKRQTTRSNAAHLTLRELDVLKLLKEGLQNKEIAEKLFVSAKTVDHHISAILTKLEVNSRGKAVQQAISLEILE